MCSDRVDPAVSTVEGSADRIQRPARPLRNREVLAFAGAPRRASTPRDPDAFGADARAVTLLSGRITQTTPEATPAWRRSGPWSREPAPGPAASPDIDWQPRAPSLLRLRTSQPSLSPPLESPFSTAEGPLATRTSTGCADPHVPTVQSRATPDPRSNARCASSSWICAHKSRRRSRSSGPCPRSRYKDRSTAIRRCVASAACARVGTGATIIGSPLPAARHGKVNHNHPGSTDRRSGYATLYAFLGRLPSSAQRCVTALRLA